MKDFGIQYANLTVESQESLSEMILVFYETFTGKTGLPPPGLTGTPDSRLEAGPWRLRFAPSSNPGFFSLEFLSPIVYDTAKRPRGKQP